MASFGITGRQALRVQIQNLAQAEEEFAGMIDAELKPLESVAVDTMHRYSDVWKNRISGDMIAAMKARYQNFVLKFGFIDGYQPNQRGDDGLYMKLQTVTGFTRGETFIRPSLALQDTQLDMKKHMNEATRRVRKNFMQRLRRRG